MDVGLRSMVGTFEEAVLFSLLFLSFDGDGCWWNEIEDFEGRERVFVRGIFIDGIRLRDVWTKGIVSLVPTRVEYYPVGGVDIGDTYVSVIG